MPSCDVCRLEGHEALRERWGCDAPVEPEAHAVFRTTCSRCEGDGCGPEFPECVNGLTEHRQCPTAIIRKGAEWIGPLFAAYHAFDQHGVLPSGGAWLDQTAQFHHAVAVIGSERARWDRIEAAHWERERKRAEAKNKKGIRR